MNSIEELWQTLVRASVDRRHPWRVVGFSTQGPNGPSSRNVILRKVQCDARRLVFFTDARSEKLQDIAADARVALLFWHPQQQLQVRASATVEIETNSTVAEHYWSGIPDHARRDYGSTQAPGAVMTGAESGDYDLSLARDQFVVLNAHVHAFDVLQLAREGHARCRFDWTDTSGGAWSRHVLVP